MRICLVCIYMLRINVPSSVLLVAIHIEYTCLHLKCEFDCCLFSQMSWLLLLDFLGVCEIINAPAASRVS